MKAKELIDLLNKDPEADVRLATPGKYPELLQITQVMLNNEANYWIITPNTLVP